MWLYNFVSVAGNVGLNVEFDIVITQTIGECLCHYVRRVEGYLVGCGDIVIHFNREGNAQSGQLFDCLFLIFFCFLLGQLWLEYCRLFRPDPVPS